MFVFVKKTDGIKSLLNFISIIQFKNHFFTFLYCCNYFVLHKTELKYIIYKILSTINHIAHVLPLGKRRLT